MAGSGMITGGRIKHHLVREISRPESTLIFVGYQAVGTLGEGKSWMAFPCKYSWSILPREDENREH